MQEKVMKKDMVKNIYKSPRRLRAKYTHRTNLAVYALDISPLRGAAGQQRTDRVSERNLPQAASTMFRYSPEIRKLLRDMPGLWGRHPVTARKTSTGCFQMYPADA